MSFNANQVTFNGDTYFQNIDNVSNKIVKPFSTNNLDVQGMLDVTVPSINESDLENFFVTFNNTHPLPSSWDQFVSAWTSYVTNTLHNNTGIIPDQMLTSFVQVYQPALGMAYNDNLGNATGGDWSLLNATNGDVQNQFQQAFTTFLQAYPYSGTNGTVTEASFFDNWYKFIAVTAFLKSSTTPGTGLSYETIFKTFFPNGNFQQQLLQFYNKVLSDPNSNGYFNPSQMLSQWVSQVQQQYNISLSGTGVLGPLTTSVDTSQTKKTAVLNNIFFLLVELITSVQKAAAAQASRLNFLTGWQQAYTELQNQVPTFTQHFNNGVVGTIGSTTNKAANARNDANRINASFITQIQANTNIVSDYAKSLQSSVNQTNDATNQQSDMATTFIQDLQTIISAIFK